MSGLRLGIDLSLKHVLVDRVQLVVVGVVGRAVLRGAPAVNLALEIRIVEILREPNAVLVIGTERSDLRIKRNAIVPRS